MEQAWSLAEQGVLAAAYITCDRRPGWMVIKADSQDAALEAITSLPLARYWSKEYDVAGDSTEP